MNKGRAAGLIVIAALGGWLVLRSCMPEKPVPVEQTQPMREVFHASKPLRVVVSMPAQAVEGTPQDSDGADWLERELRYLLIRGRMRVAPVGVQDTTSFTLQVELPAAEQAVAKLSLLAPDGQERSHAEVPLPTQDKLAIVLALAKRLPEFLGAVHATSDWGSYIGMTDAAVYDSFLHSSGELLGPHGQGFTQPVASDSSRAVRRLEGIVRKSPQSARALALLSMSYMSQGGEDRNSLTHIAESRAERALAIDPEQADAQSVLGLVRLRRSEWVAATEYFDTALRLDANAIAALEGSACLRVDAGQARAAVQFARRAVALQPANVGANTCLAYAQLATNEVTAATEQDPPEAARIKALAAVLSGNTAAAQQTLQTADDRTQAWIEPLLRASTEKHHRAEAIRAITLAASDGSIDAFTEILCGAALRQSDFVFNRMLRLRKQNEPVPLRVLWLPQTAFLRVQPEFEDIVSAAGLLPFWQDHGAADICAQEPAVYGCNLAKQH